MRTTKLLISMILALLLTGGLCDSTPEADEEESSESSEEEASESDEAAGGTINEDLDELRDGLEETAGERQERQDETIRRANDP